MDIHRVLVTGAAGYIGSVLTGRLLDRGYKVWGLDLLMFGKEPPREFQEHPHYRFVGGDVRDPASYQSILDQVDAVIHLAAIVGMPACSRYPDLARQTNWVATKTLFDLAAQTQNIKRFLFASSTSVYGALQGNGLVDEESPPKPISLYAELKIRCEEYILQGPARTGFVPTVLRFPTAYGLSPQMRFDLAVNEFARELALGKKLEVFGQQRWRPYCHVVDLARGCIQALEAPEGLVRREVYCVGDTRENYTKQMICEMLLKSIPDGEISITQEGKEEDIRDYRVSFSKIKRIHFSITKTVQDGIREVYQALKQGLISNPYDATYTRDF